MNHNCVQTTELQLGRRSPHCEPTPSAPFAALKKWRTDAARRDTQRRCWFVQSTIQPQKWRETRMMAQFESGQLKSGTKTALHNEMWISIFLFYQALFYYRRKLPTKSPAVQLPYTKAAFIPRTSKCVHAGEITCNDYLPRTAYIYIPHARNYLLFCYYVCEQSRDGMVTNRSRRY